MTYVVEEADVQAGVAAQPEKEVIRNEGEREKAETPRTRIPFGVPHQKMAVILQFLDPSYHYHWINDVGGRASEAIAGGYLFVMRREVEMVDGVVPGNTDPGDKISRIVGSWDGTAGVRAYLMKIRKEFYEEDQAAIQSINDATDAKMRRGALGTPKGLTPAKDDPNFYSDTEAKSGFGKIRASTEKE